MSLNRFLAAAAFAALGADAHATLPNPGFEQPSLAGWTDGKGAALTSDRRFCGHVDAGSARSAGYVAMKNSPRALGGDYWDVPVHAGVDRGACSLVVGPGQTVLSPQFTLAARSRFVSFVATSLSADGKEGVLGKMALLGPKGEVLVQGALLALPKQWTRMRLDLGAKVSRRKVRLRLFHDGPKESRLIVDNLVQSATRPNPNPTGELAQLYGFADLHTHFFTQIGQGGRMFAGRIHSCIGHDGVKCNAPSDMSKALPTCQHHHGTSQGLPFQGPDGVSTIVPEGGHHVGGYPSFKGWPRHTSLSHQQMYVDWLKRAWAGGLRLVHMDVLSNPIMAWAYETTSVLLPGKKLPNPVSEEWNIDQQLKAARAFAKMPDVRGWLGVATTAAQAEALVREGKLAVVLGVEADDLGGFTTNQKFRADAARAGKGDGAARERIRGQLRAYLKTLHGKGVRHVFPVHVFDNVFGGAAVYDVKLDAGNYLFHGFGKNGYRFFETANAWRSGERGEGVFVREDHEIRELYNKVTEYLGIARVVELATKPEVVIPLLPLVLPILAVFPVAPLALPALTLLPAVHLLTKALLVLEQKIGVRKILKSRLDSFPPVPHKARLGIVNKHGLSAAGEVFMEESMRLGMVIDLSHMSEKATNRALDVAESCQYPLIAGHTGFRETSFGTWRNASCSGGRCLNDKGYFSSPVPNTDVGWSEETAARLGTHNPESLAAERSLSRKQVQRIRDLGGMLGMGTGNGAQPRAWAEKGQTAVAPDCDGTTKSWVQQYRYAVMTMKDAQGRMGGGIALGTDANGFVSMLGPRFGPLACTASFGDKVRGGATVVAQATAQRNGVRYGKGLDQGVRYWDKERFSGASTLEVLPPYPDGFWKFMGDLVSGAFHDLRPATTKIIEDHQAIWTGLARFFAGAGPTTHWGCATDGRGVDRDAYRYAFGFRLAADGRARPTCDCGGLRDPFSAQGCTGGDTNADSKSSWDVWNNRPQSEWWDPASGRTARVQRIVAQWKAMAGTNPPLQKSVVRDKAGRVTRDFDYNLDGLAHYGMLPDMLQDARNVGLSKAELAPLFRGADAYVAMWKRIEARSQELRGPGALACAKKK